MKFLMRSAHLFLILILISFVGIIPASSDEEVIFPSPYSCYRPYDVINSRMTELTNLYPELVRLKTIGQSFEGRPIQVLQLGREVETNTKPRLVLVSGLQANTLTPVELNLRFAEFLLESYDEDINSKWLLEETEIHLILIANPDGRLIAEQQALNFDVPTWTKNRQPYECTDGNGGVSLDQNFSYEWSTPTTDACAPNFPGPSAASEPETQAIQSYLEQLLSQNTERSLVIDLQNEGEWLITPFLFSRTVENPDENDLYMLANKLAYATETMPNRGVPDNLIITGTLTDFAFGQLEAPALRFNLGSSLVGGEVTYCEYFEQTLAPQGLSTLTRAAILAVEPLNQAQGPEIIFDNVNHGHYSTSVIGHADEFSLFKVWLNPGEYSPIHHVSFSLDTPPWQQDATFTQVDWSQPLPDDPYTMNFEHTFQFTELTPGKHTVYFQAWDTDISGEAGQAGMINAIEINEPFLIFIPLSIR